MCVVASQVSPTGDLGHNPGTHSDRGLNQQPLGSQASTQSTEPHQPGLNMQFLFDNHTSLKLGRSLKKKVYIVCKGIQPSEELNSLNKGFSSYIKGKKHAKVTISLFLVSLVEKQQFSYRTIQPARLFKQLKLHRDTIVFIRESAQAKALKAYFGD